MQTAKGPTSTPSQGSLVGRLAELAVHQRGNSIGSSTLGKLCAMQIKPTKYKSHHYGGEARLLVGYTPVPQLSFKTR